MNGGREERHNMRENEKDKHHYLLKADFKS